MADKSIPKIVILAPRRIKWYPKSGLAKFYRGLTTSLQESGYRAKLKFGPYRVPEANGNFFLTYHTIANRPDVLNIKGGYLLNYMLADQAGYSGWASVVDAEEDWANYEPEAAGPFATALRKRYVEQQFSKYHQHSKTDDSFDIPTGSVAVFLQCQDDTVMSLARHSTRDMVNAIIAQRGKRPVVIKRHPVCDSEEITQLLNEVVDPENGVYQSQENVHAITARADAVACVNSGAGFDSLLHGKKVLVFGVSDYRHAAFEITDLAQVGPALDAPNLSEAHINGYLYWYLNRHSLHVKSPTMGEDTIAKIRARMANTGGDPSNWAEFPPWENAAEIAAGKVAAE